MGRQGMCSSKASHMHLSMWKLPQPWNFQHRRQSMAGLTPKSAGICVYSNRVHEPCYLHFSSWLNWIASLQPMVCSFAEPLSVSSRPANSPLQLGPQLKSRPHFQNSWWLNIMKYMNKDIMIYIYIWCCTYIEFYTYHKFNIRHHLICVQRFEKPSDDGNSRETPLARPTWSLLSAASCDRHPWVFQLGKCILLLKTK